MSGTAADFLNSAAPRLASRFDALLSTFAPALLLLCARTNKIAVSRAKKCLLLIAKHCKLPSLLPYLREAGRDKSQTLRIVSLEVLATLLEACEHDDRLDRRTSDVEHMIRLAATDRDADVRQCCKRVFDWYAIRWPLRSEEYVSPKCVCRSAHIP